MDFHRFYSAGKDIRVDSHINLLASLNKFNMPEIDCEIIDQLRGNDGPLNLIDSI